MRVFLCALVVCLSAGRALADESPEARGAELMEAQQYHAALRELEAAYAARQDPHTLLLIARAHQRLGHAGEAIDFYTRFLASGPADPAENAEAEAEIARLRPLVPVPERPATLGGLQGLGGGVQLAPVRLEKRHPRGLLAAGITLLSIGYGGAFITGSVLAGVSGGGSESDSHFATASGLLLIPVVGPIISSIYLPSVTSVDAAFYWSMPWMLSSAGLQVAGLIMTVIGATTTEKVPVVVPYSLPGGGGLSLSGRF